LWVFIPYEFFCPCPIKAEQSENIFDLALLQQAPGKTISILLYYSKLSKKIICHYFITASCRKNYFALASLQQAPEKNNLPLLYYSRLPEKIVCSCFITAAE